MTVAVVGAGFAGLRAAMLLERLGHDVLVYEARDRLGGRAWTQWGPEGFVESGGEWIDSDHKRVFALLQELGLEAEASHQWPGRLWFDGDEVSEDSPWPEVDQAEAALENLARNLLVRLDEREPVEDTATLGSALDELDLTPRGRWCLEAKLRSDEGEDPDRVGLLGWACGYRHYLERSGGEMSSYRFATGAQGVCQAMADRLKNPVCFGFELLGTTVENGRVQLASPLFSVVVDRCVLTLPPRALEKVVSPAKRASVKAMGSARAVKIVLAFRRRWWQDQGWSGRLMANRAFQQCWDIGRGDLCALGFYVCGEGAMQVLAQPDPAVYVRDSLVEIHPEAQGEFLGGGVVDWVNDRYSLGAFSSLAPGSVRDAVPYAAQPDGPVHFAGEWTSSWGGFYEGALESAERVAAEIGPA